MQSLTVTIDSPRTSRPSYALPDVCKVDSLESFLSVPQFEDLNSASSAGTYLDDFLSGDDDLSLCSPSNSMQLDRGSCDSSMSFEDTDDLFAIKKEVQEEDYKINVDEFLDCEPSFNAQIQDVCPLNVQFPVATKSKFNLTLPHPIKKGVPIFSPLDPTTGQQAWRSPLGLSRTQHIPTPLVPRLPTPQGDVNMEKVCNYSLMPKSISMDSLSDATSPTTSECSSRAGDKEFPCSHPGCDSILKTKFSLRRHLKRHQGSKPFECKKCRRQFVDATALKRHSRTHTGEKPFRCNIPGCNKTFSDVSNRRRHEISHQGLKPYQCTLADCLKCFTRRDSLKEHLLSVHRLSNKDEQFNRVLSSQKGRKASR